jgi:hypothetical protein
MDAETKQALEAMELRILERIEATETKLLRAFLGWAAQACWAKEKKKA